MSMRILQILLTGISCHGFVLKMGPKPIFVGEADTAKTPRLGVNGGGLV